MKTVRKSAATSLQPASMSSERKTVERPEPRSHVASIGGDWLPILVERYICM